MANNVKLMIQFNSTEMTLPINPEEITIAREGDNEDLDIIGLGKTVRKGEPGLVTATIESFFPWRQSYLYKNSNANIKSSVSWSDINNPNTYSPINGLSTVKAYRDKIMYGNPEGYITFLNLIWYSENTNNNVAKIISTGLPMNINMYFVIENFEYDHKAGEEKDVYYRLDIKQYVPYGVKTIKDLTSGLYQNRTYATFSPYLNSFALNNYIVQEGDTFWSISQKLINDGSRWKELYNLNKHAVSYYSGTSISQSIKLIAGTSLTIPDEWSGSYLFDVLALQRGGVQ